ncbi:MAG: AAA family ATPase, partial [Acidimicrobiales bacterium]|nr:AAA family ATPase [Acidimicrobiales bacterium]
MSGGTLLVTPDGEFEAQVKRAFDGDLDADRFWDDHIPRTQPETAVRQIAQSQPQVVVLGPGLAPPVTIALAEAFDLLHPEVCVVIVAKPSTRLWERALRAGVREIITPGSEDDQIRDALTRAGSAAARRRATSSSIAQHEEAPRGRVITVMSPKGGAGKTTVATNLATRLALSAPGRVAIIDLDLQFGDVASALNLDPEHTLLDVVRGPAVQDSMVLKTFLTQHQTGLYAVCG